MFSIKDNSTPTVEEYKLMVGSISRAVSSVLAREAFRLSNEMKNGLIDQQPGGKPIRPLSKMTILLRGFRSRRKPGKKKAKKKVKKTVSGGFRGGKKPTHTKALIDSASMVNSIKARRKSIFHYTVGVHSNVRSKNGKDLVNKARIHEYGTKVYTVTVTPKMHRFSVALYLAGILRSPWRVGQELRRQIPARPFLNPAKDVWEEGADTRFTVEIGAVLGVTP
jgi:hypothetical protein